MIVNRSEILTNFVEKGCPVWYCTKCKRFFQTKSIAVLHEIRKHGKGDKE